MIPIDQKYNVDGFCRRIPEPGPPPRPPPVIVGEVIEISSGDESDSSPNHNLDRLPLNILQIKREQVVEQLNAINGNDSNEIAENEEFELNQDNAISEPTCHKVSNEQNAVKTSLKETGAHGYQTPESLGQTSTSGISSIVNYPLSDDDDFMLDLAGSNSTGYNHTKQQMNNVSTPKVLFSMKSEKKKKDTTRLPLQNFPENVIQNDDTTQMVPDYNEMYSIQNENFSTENTFADRFGTKSDLFPQNTPTMYPTHSHQPHETSSTNYNENENVKLNHSYNAGMNNGDSNQYQYRNPLDNGFFQSNCATPVYTSMDQPSIQDMLKAGLDKIKEEQDQKRNEDRDKMIEEVLKKIEDKGLIVVPKDEYELLKKERANNRENSPHHTTKNGDHSSSKRHSMSPNHRSDGYEPDISSEKRHKSSLHNHRDQASTSSKHIHRHDYHRSSSSSSKVGKSSHKTSTITSGSYQFHNVSNPSAMDYENASSSESIPSGSSVQSSVEKEKTPPATNSGVQFKYKSSFGKDNRFASSFAKSSRNESDYATQKNQSKFGAHRAYKFTSEQKTRRSIVKNTDKSLHLNSTEARTCPICKRNYKRMVAHMKTVHEQYEVYVSRISQPMVDMAISRALPRAIKYIKHKSTQYLKATCLFCEEDKDFMPHYWNDHIRSHTGEWGHECRLCLKNTCFYTHCSHPTSKIVEFNAYVENLYAFLCRKCNYIQLDEKNIHKHLKNEHEMKNPQLDREYQKIMLLPAMKNLQFSRNPHLPEAQNSGIPRFFGKTSQPQSKQRTHAPAAVHSLPSTNGIMVLEDRVIRPAMDTETEEIQQPENMHNANNDAEMQNQNQSADMYDQNNENLEMAINDGNNAYKIDAEEENVLWGNYNNFNEISIDYNYAVRPWIDDYAKKPAIHLMTQFALYKCMHLKCLYSTDNPDNWEIHMAKHIDMIDVLDKRNVINKENRSNHIKFRECPYCQYEAKANFQTRAHMEQTHCRSAFQCAHCFYRSIEMDNMVLHYEMHHKDKSRKILLCNDEVEFQQSDEEQLKSYCDQNVEKIKCGQDACSEEFVCFNTFYLHLKVCHPNNNPNEGNTYKCIYCFVDVECTESDIQKHLKSHKDVHCFNEFHCLYCKNGFEDIDQIRAHMSDHHASHFLFIVARRSPKPEDDEEDFQLVHIGDLKNYRNFSFYKCTDPIALELMEPTVLDVQKQLLQANQNCVNQIQFSGKPPSMKCKIKDDFFIKYDDYIKIPRYRSSSKSIETTSHPVNQASKMRITQSPAKSPEQMVQNVPPQVKVTSRHPIKSEFNQVNYDLNQFGSAVDTHSSDQPTITYKCISIKAADELENIQTRLYMTQLCHDCTKFIKMDANTGLNPYISHLMEENDHPCTEFSPTEKYMMQHRIKAHGESSIIYIVKEETSNTLVYKLVRCQFECLACKLLKFENVSALKKHHQTHLNRYLRGTVIQKIRVIQSNDPEQPVNSCTEVTNKYSLCNLFWCNRHEKIIGTRQNALKHHKDFHPKHNFEYSIKSMLVESNTMENDDHSLYVLECEHCMQLFGSTESVQAHIERIRNENPNSSDNALYTVKQLLVCPECKIVSTFSGLDAHYSAKHPEKNAILPVHIMNNKLCGLCRMEERDANHFERAHVKGEVVGNVLLRKLRMDRVDITSCTFAPGCCSEMRFDQIAQVINHVSNCRNRCFCNLCPDLTFTGANEFITHRKNEHNENLQQILENIHDIKKFMSLLAEMRLIFPNRFVVTKKAIEDTSIGKQLSEKISQPVFDLFEREKLWFNTILLLGP